jgi:hypothetical protein
MSKSANAIESVLPRWRLGENGTDQIAKTRRRNPVAILNAPFKFLKKCVVAAHPGRARATRLGASPIGKDPSGDKDL